MVVEKHVYPNEKRKKTKKPKKDRNKPYSAKCVKHYMVSRR